MKKQLTKGLLFVCALAVMGMMAACGGNESTTAASGDDEMHIEAKRLAKMTVEQMKMAEKADDFSDSLIEKYEDSATFVKFQIIYYEDLLKLDIEQEDRDYLNKTLQYLKGEITPDEYNDYCYDPEFGTDDEE